MARRLFRWGKRRGTRAASRSAGGRDAGEVREPGGEKSGRGGRIPKPLAEKSKRPAGEEKKKEWRKELLFANKSGERGSGKEGGDRAEKKGGHWKSSNLREKGTFREKKEGPRKWAEAFPQISLSRFLDDCKVALNPGGGKGCRGNGKRGKGQEGKGVGKDGSRPVLQSGVALVSLGFDLADEIEEGTRSQKEKESKGGLATWEILLNQLEIRGGQRGVRSSQKGRRGEVRLGGGEIRVVTPERVVLQE